jgi:hypothetical protein
MQPTPLTTLIATSREHELRLTRRTPPTAARRPRDDAARRAGAPIKVWELRGER